MRRRLASALCALASIGASMAVSAQEAAIPPLTAQVVDAAALMTPDQRAALESTLADYEARKGTQIAVLTVASTAPEAIEQYGIRVAEAWKIGRRRIADGVILIVAKDNPRDLRRVRIEVGRGLEGAVTDERSRRIIDEALAPHFRANDYYGGLVAAIGRIESLLEGEALPAATSSAGPVTATTGGLSFGGLLILFLVVALINASRRRRFGYVTGARGLNGSLGPMVLGGILGSLGGSGGGGSGGGSGGGGGGFTGGGGDFGGGGASGDW